MIPAELQETLAALTNSPKTVQGLVDRLSDEQLRMKTSDEFSALENVCHLRDIELEGYAPRIARILTEYQPVLQDIDGGRLAAERDYNHQNLAEALQAFVLARTNNVRALRALTPEQRKREGRLEGVGTISLERLLEMMLEHDENHIREVEVICRRLAREQAKAD